MGSPLYRVRLEDGNEYGPTDEDSVKKWIEQGVVTQCADAARTDESYRPILAFSVFRTALTEKYGEAPDAVPATSAPARAHRDTTQEKGSPQTAIELRRADPDAARAHESIAAGDFSEVTPPPSQAPKRPTSLVASDSPRSRATKQSDAVVDFVIERRDFEDACRYLAGERFEDAETRLARLVSERPESSEYQSALAYARWCLARAAENGDEQRDIASRLRELTRKYPYCAVSLHFLARTLLETDPRSALNLLRQALKIDPSHKMVIAAAQEATLRCREDVTTKIVRDSSVAARRSSEAVPDPTVTGIQFENTRLMAIFGFAVVCGPLIAAAFEAEALGTVSALRWIQYCTLVLAGFIGAKALLKQWPIHSSHFRLKKKWTVGASAYGALMGLLLPTGVWGVDGSVAIVISIAIVSALSQEVFFRGFIVRALDVGITQAPVAVSVAAALHFVWMLPMGPTHAALLAVAIGIPLNALYVYSRSFVPSAACHVAFAISGTLLQL